MNEMTYTGEGGKENNGEVRLNLKREDIHPEIPEVGGTVLVLQVNAKDDRTDPKSPEFGALVPEAAEQVKTQAENFFNDVFEKLGDEEKQKVRVLVVASDASLTMPDGKKSPHKRAVDTGDKVIEGVRSSLDKYSLSHSQLLNESASSDRGPITMSKMTDLTMFDQSPEFVKYMTDKYGPNKEFWMTYEDDSESERRLELGAEGPSEIAIRMREALASLTQDVAKQYHKEHPDTILYIWAVSHYDSISPYVKGYVYQANPARLFVPTEKGGGITIKIDKDGKDAETVIGGQRYKISSILKRPIE